MITASQVKDLREKTGAGMMDCKKVLTETDGDMEKAIELLRERGIAKAAKKSGRVAAEGLVEAYVSEDGKVGAIVEVNAETDFVAKNEEFKTFVANVAKQVAEKNPKDVEELLAQDSIEEPGKTVNEVLIGKIATIGENMNIRRFARFESEGLVEKYIHGDGKIAVLVSMKSGDKEVAKDVCMQIAAARPEYLNEAAVPAERLEKEKEILKAQKFSQGKGLVAINAMVALKDYDELINAALESKVDAIISGAGLPLRLPELVKDHDVLIAPIVSSGKACKVIIKHWLKKYQRTPDFIVIEGSQAGGHLGFKKEDLENQTCQSLEEIFKDVEEIVENNKLNIPIFVAGGISQRSDVKHFFDLGVDGIQVATRFITTYECDASIKYKEAFLKARKEDIGFVSSPVGMPGRAMQNSFVKKTKKEKIPVKKCYQCLIPCDVKNTPYCISRALIEAVKGNLEDGLIFTGAHGYRQDHLMHVDEVIHELMEDDK